MRERDWYSIRLAVHSGATSAGRKTMTTPKTKFAGLALIAALCAGVTLGLMAHANVEVQYNLGVMYERGQGATRDYAEAVGWWPQGRRAGPRQSSNQSRLYVR